MNKNYLVDFQFSEPQYGTVTLMADGPEQAEDLAYEYVKETYPEAANITIDSVEELAYKNG